MRDEFRVWKRFDATGWRCWTNGAALKAVMDPKAKETGFPGNGCLLYLRNDPKGRMIYVPKFRRWLRSAPRKDPDGHRSVKILGSCFDAELILFALSRFVTFRASIEVRKVWRRTANQRCPARYLMIASHLKRIIVMELDRMRPSVPEFKFI